MTLFSASASTILGNGVQTTFDGFTLVRTRGLLRGFLRTATSAGDGFQGALGIGIVSSAAFNVGVGSVPTPITEVGWEGWVFWSPVSLHSAVAGVSVAASEEVELTVDSKAMRKFNSDMTLFAVLELIEIGTAAASFFFDSRMLFKLP